MIERGLMFTVSEDDALEHVRTYLNKQPLAPGNLASGANFGAAERHFVPFWICGARVLCGWTAKGGDYVGSRGESGRRKDRDVLWRDESGAVEKVFDDVAIPATSRLDPKQLAKLDEWPIAQLAAVSATATDGAIVHPAEVQETEAAARAKETMERLIRNLCELEIPGDTFMGLQIAPQFSDERASLAWLPMWRFSYTYRDKRFDVLVNGCTGKVAGDAPTSVAKALVGTLMWLVLIGGAIAAAYCMAR